MAKIKNKDIYLEDNDQIYFGDSQDSAIWFADEELHVTFSGGLSLKDDAGNLGIFVADSGKVGIGGITNPDVALDVNGLIRASDNFITGSTARTYVGEDVGGVPASGTEGTVVTAVGRYAAYQNNQNYQTAIGRYAGYKNRGNSQTVVGDISGYENTGNAQTAIGDAAGHSNVGHSQTALGAAAGHSNTGANQVAIGYNAGFGNSGDAQIVVGAYAGLGDTGDETIGIGYEALRGNSADNVVAIGYQAGKDNATANQFIVKQTNVSGVPLIQGDFSTGKVGINQSSSAETLGVKGNFSVENEANTKRLTLGWQTNYSDFWFYNGSGWSAPMGLADTKSNLGAVDFYDGWVGIGNLHFNTLDGLGDIYTAGNVGINTAPSYPLHIVKTPGNETFYGAYFDIDSGGTLTSNRDHNGLVINFAAMTDRDGHNYTARGLHLLAFTSDPGDVSSLYGLSFEAQHNAATTLDSLYSIYSKSSTFNTVTNLYGVRSELFIAPGGDSSNVVNIDSYNNMNSTGNTVPALSAFNAYVVNTAGTLTAAYLYRGIYVAGGTYGTKWGIHLSGETKNYFSGRVGIGITDPLQKFTVAASENNTVLGDNTEAAVRIINSYTAAVGRRSELQFGLGTNQQGYQLATIAAEYISWDGTYGAGGDLIFGTKKASDPKVTERMRIDQEGDILLAGLNPYIKSATGGADNGIYVQGGGSTNGSILVIGDGATSVGNVYAIYGGVYTANHIRMHHDGTDGYVTTGAGDLILNPDSGLVGIGDVPTEALHVLGAGIKRIKVESTDDQSEFQITNDTSNWSVYMPKGSSDLRFYNLADKFTLYSAGGGLLGGNDVTLNLQNTTAAAGAGGVLRFGHNQAASVLPMGEIRGELVNGAGVGSRAGDLSFWTSNAGVLGEAMRITYAGRIGFGTAGPGYTFHFNKTDTGAATVGGILRSSFTFSGNAAANISQTGHYLNTNSTVVGTQADGTRQTFTNLVVASSVNTPGNVYHHEGIYVSVNHNHTTDTTGLYGGRLFAVNASTGTVDVARGFYGVANNQSTGTLTGAYGLSGSVWGVGAGTIGSAFGVYSNIWRNAGTITTGYLYWGSYSGAVGTAWGLYFQGETKSYMSGQLGIGGDPPVGEELYVAGDIHCTGKLTSDLGNDPPYVLYDSETRQSIVDRIKKEVPTYKLNGAVLFYNSPTNEMELFLPIEGTFKSLLGNKLLETVDPITETYGTKDYHYLDKDTGEIKTTQVRVKAKAFEFAKDCEIDNETGKFYKRHTTIVDYDSKNNPITEERKEEITKAEAVREVHATVNQGEK